MRTKQEEFNYKDNTLQYGTQIQNEWDKTPFVLGNDFNCSNIIWIPIVKEIEINIPIPEGYQVVPGKQISVQTSFDQHNITPVVVKQEVTTDLNFADDENHIINMDTCVDIYKIKLVGNLYYNSVVCNLEPVGSCIEENDTLFNSYGGIVFNDILAYVNDIDEVPCDVKESLTYNIIVNSVKTDSNSSCILAQNLNNTATTVTISISIVVTSNNGPIS